MKRIASIPASERASDSSLPEMSSETVLPSKPVNPAPSTSEMKRTHQPRLRFNPTDFLGKPDEATQWLGRLVRAEPELRSRPSAPVGVSSDDPTNNADASSKLGPAGVRWQLATDLIDLHGPTTEADRQVVAIELVKLPVKVLNALKADGARIIVTRGSVADYKPSLKGVRPRGWPPGKTWDHVPGMQDGNNVVIATRLGKDGQPHVPPKGEGHECFSLVLHETLHRYDSCNDYSAQSAFRSAREKDKTYLKPYWLQKGRPGRRETFAAIGDRVFSGVSYTEKLWPNLRRYFLDNHY